MAFKGLEGRQSYKRDEVLLETRTTAGLLTLFEAFIRVPVLRHFDPQRPSKVETDASDGTLGCIYSQLFEDGWHPIAFYSRQFKGPKINYKTPDKEMYSIVEAFRYWRYYLEDSRYTIEVWTDY